MNKKILLIFCLGLSQGIHSADAMEEETMPFFTKQEMRNAVFGGGGFLGVDDLIDGAILDELLDDEQFAVDPQITDALFGDDVLDELLYNVQPSVSVSDAIRIQVINDVGEKVGDPVVLPFDFENFNDNKFFVINRLVQDLEGDKDFSIPMPAVHGMSSLDMRGALLMAIELYHNPAYLLPKMTPKELSYFMKVLNYLEAENFLQKIYVAWLNQPGNENFSVHNNTNNRVICRQMGLDPNLIDENFDYGKFVLLPEHIQNVNNYNHSIQQLIDSGDIEGKYTLKINETNPMDRGYIVDLSGEGISSIRGMYNMPYSVDIDSIDLSGNPLTQEQVEKMRERYRGVIF